METVMAGDNAISEALIRMEGKLDRLGDRMAHFERDIDRLRGQYHDTNNTITPIVMLDLPGRLRTADERHSDYDARLKVIESTEQQRKGAAKLAGLLWTILGAAGTGTVAVILRIMGSI